MQSVESRRRVLNRDARVGIVAESETKRSAASAGDDYETEVAGLVICFCLAELGCCSPFRCFFHFRTAAMRVRRGR